MRDIITSEFRATPAPLYSGNIQNFTDLKNHAIEKGFQYSEKLTDTVREIKLTKSGKSITLEIPLNYPTGFLMMSFILASIRERLAGQK